MKSKPTKPKKRAIGGGISSSDEDIPPRPIRNKLLLTKGNVLKTYHELEVKPSNLTELSEILLFDTGLKIKDYPVPPMKKVAGEWKITRELNEEELKLKASFDEAKDRIFAGLKNFKRNYLSDAGRAKVKPGGKNEHDIFFSVVDDFPELLKEETPKNSQSQGSQSSTSSTASWLQQTVPKPQQPHTRKQFRFLTRKWKNRKTDLLFKQIQKKAEELEVDTTDLCILFGYRASYIENRKLAKGFEALAKADLDKDLSLDKALFVKFRFSLSKADWIDFRLLFIDTLFLPTDGELRKYMYDLLPDEKLKPFRRGWKIDVVDVCQSTLDRLPKETLSDEVIRFKLEYFTFLDSFDISYRSEKRYLRLQSNQSSRLISSQVLMGVGPTDHTGARHFLTTMSLSILDKLSILGWP